MTAPQGGVGVNPDDVVKILVRSELGRAMWQAAYFEALSDAQAARLADLEKRVSEGNISASTLDQGWEVPGDDAADANG